MKGLPVLLLVLVACRNETALTDTQAVDTREPVSVRYVGVPELNVREQPSDTAAILATYSSGEALSVLAEKGEWSEVRTGDRSGWAKSAELTGAAEKVAQDTNPQPQFKVMPIPVSAPSARGEVYIEADVNTDGEVTSVRIITNTTGVPALAEQNANALRTARFHPMVVKGERRQFKYYHRVTY